MGLGRVPEPPLSPPLAGLVVGKTVVRREGVAHDSLIDVFLHSGLRRTSFGFRHVRKLNFYCSVVPTVGQLCPLGRSRITTLEQRLIFFGAAPTMYNPIVNIATTVRRTQTGNTRVSSNAVGNVGINLVKPLTNINSPLI